MMELIEFLFGEISWFLSCRSSEIKIIIKLYAYNFFKCLQPVLCSNAKESL